MIPTLPISQQLSTVPKWLIIFVFCLFAGLIAETFVTASTSPVHFLHEPFTIPFNVLFYGTFDLLAREILVRRRARLASALLLGAAYGFINEGVAAGTWYVIHPQGYIFIGRVDWAWALALTIFHAIISVLAPIAFIEDALPVHQGPSFVASVGDGELCSAVIRLHHFRYRRARSAAAFPFALSACGTGDRRSLLMCCVSVAFSARCYHQVAVPVQSHRARAAADRVAAFTSIARTVATTHRGLSGDVRLLRAHLLVSRLDSRVASITTRWSRHRPRHRLRRVSGVQWVGDRVGVDMVATCWMVAAPKPCAAHWRGHFHDPAPESDGGADGGAILHHSLLPAPHCAHPPLALPCKGTSSSRLIDLTDTGDTTNGC